MCRSGGALKGPGALLYLASAAGVCSTTALIMYRHGRSLDFAGEEVRGRGGGRGGGNTPSLQDRNTWLRIAVMA